MKIESEFPGLYLNFLNYTGMIGLMFPKAGVIKRIANYLHITLMLVVLVSNVFLSAYSLMSNQTSLDDMIAVLYVQIPTFLTVVRFVFYLANVKNIQSLFEICKQDFLNSGKSNENRNIIFKNGQKFTNNLIYYITILIYLSSASWILAPIMRFLYHKFINPSLYVPWTYKILLTVYPISIAQSSVFALIWFYEFYFLEALIFLFMFNDCIMLVIVCMLCTQLEILQSNLENINLHQAQHRIMESNILEEHAYQQLIGCIEDHQKILKISKLVKTTFNPVITFQLTIIVSSLLLVCFRMTIINSLVEDLKNTLYFVEVVSQLFLICWSSSRLINSSQKIQMSSLDANWIARSKKFKYALQMLIMRSQIPVTLVAYWGVISMDLPTTIGVLRVTYSYYTLLQQVNAQKALEL